MYTRAGTHMICTEFPSVFMCLLILLPGDIETNPGPFIAQQNQSDCMSVLHLNIRSIRYKLDFIKDNFLDFDVLCFSETHLTNDISNELLELDGFLPPFRKDSTAHSGGLLIYISDKFVVKRRTIKYVTVDTLLRGRAALSIKENISIFSSVHEYIRETKRF